MEFITDVPQTSFRKDHDGWMGTTYQKIKGYAYQICTLKMNNGMITSSAQKLASNDFSGKFTGTSFMIGKDINIPILRERALATEAKIRELHTKALEMIGGMLDKFPQCTEDAKPHIGQLVFISGYGKENEKMAIYEITGGMASTVNLETLQMGRHEIETIRNYKELRGIGMYFISGDTITPDKLSKLLADARAKKVKDEAERPAREAAAKAELEKQTAELVAQYPYLLKQDNTSGRAKHVAVNVRIELKRAFPEVKFSVTSERDTVNVRWTDGPSSGQVKDITDKWEDHVTDITGDYRDPAPTLFNDIFGGVNYMFENRDMSEDTRAKLTKWAEEMYAKDQKYNTHDKGNLAYRLFVQFPIPSVPWEVLPTGKDSGLNSPETFWKIAPVVAQHPTSHQPPSTNHQPLSTNHSASVSRNTDKNGIEIRFPEKPEQSVIDNLKAHNFRWSGFSKCWWVKYSDSAWQFANSL